MKTFDYRVFANIEEFVKYYEISNSSIKWLKSDYYWIKTDNNNNNYFISITPFHHTIEKSLIVNYGLFYLHFDNNHVHSILAKNIKYKSFENKLYHLTHGPKALSIPEAFRILSL